MKTLRFIFILMALIPLTFKASPARERIAVIGFVCAMVTHGIVVWREKA